MPYSINKGVKIYFETRGDGIPLVLQHGYTSSLNRWKECGYVEALKDRFELILIDARGHGLSDKPHRKVDYDWQLRTEDILAVVNDLGYERFNFWGYSMGGVYGFNLAKSVSHRLISLVVGGAHPYATSFEAFNGIDGTNKDEFMNAFENLVGESFSPESRKRMLTNDLQALVAAAGNRESLEDAMLEVNVPCLMYVGENDSRFVQVKQFASRLQNASFTQIPGQNHAETNARSDLVLPHVTKFLSNHNPI